MILPYLIRLYHKNSRYLRVLPLAEQVRLASWGRRWFMKRLVNQNPGTEYRPDKEWERTLWGIKFRTPLGNAAGMFKNGEGYANMAALGAGAFIGGTSTANPRQGNTKNGIYLPFISLPQSKIALNFLGLPNYGDALLSAKPVTLSKVEGCPIGWSVMRSPDFNETDGLDQLIKSLWLYHNHTQIDFIEINESCPNIQVSSANMVERLSRIAQEFLQKRKRHLPVVIKLSNDISHSSLHGLVHDLVRLGFDGLNLGNTSTAYSSYRPQITASEMELFDFFSANFAGGISGYVLKKRSLELCAVAAEVLAKIKPVHEFNLIRCGGIDQLQDILDGERNGVDLSQWYSGFFTRYMESGSMVYRDLFLGH